MKKLLFIAAALVWLAPDASAQATASVSATVVEALSITKDADLDFGTVIQGNAASVTKADAGAGKFSIAGEPNASISITYNELTNLLDGSSNQLPYSQGMAWNAADDGASATDISGGSNTATLDGTTGNAYIYLFGTVTAGATQVSGAYSADVTVNVAYN